MTDKEKAASDFVNNMEWDTTRSEAFEAGWDACLEYLRGKGEEFDGDLAEKSFFDKKPWLCMDGCSYSYANGARWQHSQDQIQIQALKERIKELEK